MYFLYSLLLRIIEKVLPLSGFFSKKMKLFVAGRSTAFASLAAAIQKNDNCIWFHAASLGEYEQGLPVMEAIKTRYPNHKIVLSFFSPSGYEVRKNNKIADVTVYLPLDTPQNAERFIRKINPELVFFIKYEYWPNYLKVLADKKIKTYLISGVFRENQLFFKWYGGFYRKALDAFTYFFVQNESSKTLLQHLGKTNVMVSGDTRFDRVATILEKDNLLDFIGEFKNNTPTVVVGSSWPKDEALLVNYLNQSTHALKWIIAPHNIKPEQIKSLAQSITKKTVLFSEREGKNLADYEVFIIDTIGILTKIYSYADLAYVGGGFGHPGVHNLLEPATFGVPIICGPHYSHFAEATALVQMGGCLSIQSPQDLQEALDTLIQNADIRHEKGHICQTFVQMNTGATQKIINSTTQN
ncbi:MAG: 3-deoxy-D-manno-octulosonic acid transferase [Flavobacterium sp.]|nr:3-deoxy-D-manno-octulosonic acid transferase [Flavobacterium sp.]